MALEDDRKFQRFLSIQLSFIAIVATWALKGYNEIT